MIYPCDYPNCTSESDFMQEGSTTPEGYHHYWCELHDPLQRKKPLPQVIYHPIVQTRIVQLHAGIYGKRPV